MGWYSVRRKGRQRSPWLQVAAGVVGGIVVFSLAYSFFLTIPVTLDGQRVRLVTGTRVKDLFDKDRVTRGPGDLVAAKDHRVLRRGDGELPYVSVNGKRVERDERLYADDVIASHDGTDTIEALERRMEPIDAPVRYEGHGSLQSVITTGEPGLREITFGSISKEVVSTRVVQKPKAQVVVRSDPHAGKKIVALTFDDGPWPRSTEAILKILQRYKIKATFFEIGVQAKEYSKISRMLADAGMLMGNHTESHDNLKRSSAAHVKQQIHDGEVDIEKASGQRPRFFRPPGGNVSSHIWPVLREERLKMVQWDVDPADWHRPGTDAIIRRVVGGVRPGAVVLMHDGGGDRTQTVNALPAIIERLKAMGYEFVTLDELMSLPQSLG